MEVFRSGSKALALGDLDVEVTGLSLPFTPSQVVVSVRQPEDGGGLISAYLTGTPTASGFTVALSAPVPGSGYYLDWCAVVQEDASAAEPAGDTLAIDFSGLKTVVANFLGYNPQSLTEAQAAEVSSHIRSGLRQFYYPPKMDGVDENFEWSFLRMSGSVTTVANLGDYLLADGFGRVAGEIRFSGDDMRIRPLAVISVHDLLRMRGSGAKGAPRFAAFQFAETHGERGQRVKMMLAPLPDRAYTLEFSGEADTGMLDETLRPFPLGGARFSELVIESCLAIAEQRSNDETGQHTAKFNQLLVSSIARDRKASATVFGFMGARSEIPPPSVRPFVRSGFRISYGGIPL